MHGRCAAAFSADRAKRPSLRGYATDFFGRRPVAGAPGWKESCRSSLPWLAGIPSEPSSPASSRLSSPDQMPGMWQRYYTRWRAATRECLNLDLLELMPPLAALCPPATVIDKIPSQAARRVLRSRSRASRTQRANSYSIISFHTGLLPWGWSGTKLRSIASLEKSPSIRPIRTRLELKPISSALSPSPANNKPSPRNSVPR